MPDHKQVQRYYDERYYAGAPTDDGMPWHMRRVAARLEPLAGKRVLDIACGAGGWLAELADRGAAISGIDISERAVLRARARLPDSDIREAVAEELPFPDGCFDLVTCMGSLEHFLDQPGALREMLRISNADARILILVPNAGFLTRRLGMYTGTNQTAIRETVRPIAEWQRMFKDAGLDVIARWRDLHPLSRGWICRGPLWQWPGRAAQALALAAWPIGWQYQLYFLCSPRDQK